MHKLAPVLMLMAAGSIVIPVAAVAQLLPAAPLSNLSSAEASGFKNAIILAGGMTGGGMTGGGMTGGGMTGGGMTGGGMTGLPGVLPGYADLPIYSGVTGDTGAGQAYGTNGTGASRSRKIYHCVTPSGRCAVDSTFGALRKGDSCGCLLGGPGKIQ